MSDVIIVAVIAVVGAIINSLIGIAILWYQDKTHKTFNSKMDLALQAQRALGDLEGRLGERTERRIREGEAALTKQQVEETVIK